MVQKKVTTKKSAKGTARASRTSAQKKKLVRAEGDRCFWVNNGPVVCDLCELHGALRGMSVEQYTHHTSDGKNDFAVWTIDVCDDPETAAKLRRAKTQAEAISIIDDALASYEF